MEKAANDFWPPLSPFSMAYLSPTISHQPFSPFKAAALLVTSRSSMSNSSFLEMGYSHIPISEHTYATIGTRVIRYKNRLQCPA